MFVAFYIFSDLWNIFQTVLIFLKHILNPKWWFEDSGLSRKLKSLRSDMNSWLTRDYDLRKHVSLECFSWSLGSITGDKVYERKG